MNRSRAVALLVVTLAAWLGGCSRSPATPDPEPGGSDLVLYRVVVDRFANGNPANDGSPVAGVGPAANYQGGDLEGLRQKIVAGYFNDLGVTALWISSPLDNPDVSGLGSDGHPRAAYQGTWPLDLTATEERFGTLAEAKAVVDAAHARGLRVLLDHTMNHVHRASALYAQHPEWFWPADLGGQPCVCGSPACPWDGPQASRCWVADFLPDLDFTVAAARQHSIDNAVWWLQQTGADGLGLDLVRMVEDVWLTDLRARLTSAVEPARGGQHLLVLGETFSGDPARLAALVGPTRLDGQVDLPLRAELVATALARSAPMTELASFLDTNDAAHGPSAAMATMLGHPALPRPIHFAEDAPLWTNPWSNGAERAWSNQPPLPPGSSAFERLANGYTLLFTLSGTPTIFQGDEVAQPGAGEPDNQRFMQWSGYSAGQALLLAHLKRLGQARAALPALRHGTRTTLSATADTLVFERRAGAQVVYVAVNRSDAARAVSGLPAGALTDRLTLATVTGPGVTVPARSAMILVPP